MRIIIFGARGRTGRELVKQATAQGHRVTAFRGDVCDPATVTNAVRGHDAVLSGLGTGSHVGLAITLIALFVFLGHHIPISRWITRLVIPVAVTLYVSRRTTVLSQGATNIIAAMKASGVRRLIWQSSLDVGNSRGQLGVLYSFFLKPLFLRGLFDDKERQEALIRQSGLDWVIVRCAALTNAPATRNYRHGLTKGFRFSTPTISRADVADFMLKQLTDDTYLHATPGIFS